MRSRALTQVAIIATTTAAGIAIVQSALPTVAVVIVASGLTIGLCVGLRPLARLLVITSFLSRVRLPGPVPFLLEHCAALVALPAAARQRSFRWAIGLTPVALFGAFIGWNAMISLLMAPKPADSLKIVAWLLVDLIVLVVMIVAQVANEDPLRFGARIAGWTAALALAIWMIAQAGFSDFGTQVDSLTGGHALYATAFEANILGSLMAMWLFVLVSSTRPIISARAYWVEVVMLLAVVFLTLTRAALLGLLIGIVVWQVLLPASRARRRAMARLLVLVLIAVAAVLSIPSLEPLRTRIGQLTDLGSSTGVSRVENWRTAVDDLSLSNIVTGLGTNSFGQRHLEPTLPHDPTPAYLGNLPLQVLYDSGVVGVLLLGAAFVTALPKPRRSRARSLGLFAVFLVSSLATSSLWFATTWIFLARGVFLRYRSRLVHGGSDEPAATGGGTRLMGASGRPHRLGLPDQ